MELRHRAARRVFRLVGRVRPLRRRSRQIEVSDIENLPTRALRDKVLRALEEGTSGSGRGFVLMPSACPYGRVLSPLCMRNYEAMIGVIEQA